VGDFAIHLQQITEEVIAAIPEAAAKGMEHLRLVAVNKTPLETGHLRGSAEVKPDPMGAEVYFPGPYARYQEYGVSHHGKELHHEVGQSFYLISSLMQETPTVLAIVTEELSKHIDG
jgi:hypothetical protein